MKRILVTGASGYIGGQTVLVLRDQGYEVIGLDQVTPSDTVADACIKFIQNDFDQIPRLNLMRTYDIGTIIHCAGTSLVGPSVANPQLYYDNNFVKTKQLLDYLIWTQMASKVRVIFSSTAAVYGELTTLPALETFATNPISPYGESKLMIEMLMNSYSRAYGLDYIIFRYFNACGADPKVRHGQLPKATHIFARLLESIRDDKQFTLYGNTYPTPDGTCIRDYIHVDDIVQAHLLAINKNIPKGIYNLGLGRGASNAEVIAAAEKHTNKKANIVIGEIRQGDPAELTASADKWKAVSNWNPKYNLADMVAHSWAWYTHQYIQ